MEEEIENLIEQLTKVRPEMLNEEALKLFNTIMAVLDERDKLIKRNEELEEKCQRYKKSKDEYKNKYIEVTNFYLESVPYSTIKEKIEELKMSGGSDGRDNIENLARELTIEVLQELMEDK